MTRRAMWNVVAYKLSGDTILAAGNVVRRVGGVCEELGLLLTSYRATLLMVECHYGQRYQDLTGRNLGFAISQPVRHAMTVEELEAQPGDD